ncbi:hypothetical protein HYU06_03605 [Candidatus Woesearchaeota archaeon]|nr:hypothetical protein [Candidatus Woesearchaeota archaeon]
MPEIMLRPLDEKYLNSVITAMSYEVRAFIVSLLRRSEFQGELDLERLTEAAEISGNGFSKENFRSHLKGALAPFLDAKVLEPDDNRRKKRTGYGLNGNGYDDLAPAVNIAYDITNSLMNADGHDRLKRSIPYILGRYINPLELIWLAEVFYAGMNRLERDVVVEIGFVVDMLKGHDVSRPSLNKQLLALEECGVLAMYNKKPDAEFGESKRHGMHIRKIERPSIALTEAGQEVFRYFKNLKLFLRADPQFFPREDRIKALKGNYPVDIEKRILYIGTNEDRTKEIAAEIKKGLNWDIDIYRMSLTIEKITLEEFRKLSAERLSGYDLVILDGYCQNGDTNRMMDRYKLLKSQQASNGITAILLTPNKELANDVERKLPINYIFITDNHGIPDNIKLQEIMYKLMVNPKSVKKAQFDCSQMLY